jgi:hypothetical protein
MIPFLTVMMGTLTFLGVLIFMLDFKNEEKVRMKNLSLFKTFYESYLLMIGSQSFKFTTFFTKLIFILATLYFVVVMLNLLVAVISDTYARV